MQISMFYGDSLRLKWTYSSISGSERVRMNTSNSFHFLLSFLIMYIVISYIILALIYETPSFLFLMGTRFLLNSEILFSMQEFYVG